MKKKLIVIFTLLFIFILSSCQKKDNIGIISSFELENIKNEFEFEEGIKSYVYISETSRRVYYYFGLKDGFKVVIDDSFMSERILYKADKSETADETDYNSSKLESPDKIYDYNNSTKELTLSIKEKKEIISNDINYDKESILDLLSNENSDILINPNFVIKSILQDLNDYGFVRSKSNITLFKTDMISYYYYLRQLQMRQKGSKFFELMKEKYLTEEEYNIYIKYIANTVQDVTGSYGNFDSSFQIDPNFTYMNPSFCLRYSGNANPYLDDGKNRYYFNVDLLNKYSTIFNNAPYY